ncbi:MAG: PEP-CTERM sorting domain-containing protein [Tepidisphaeraceae bacterium]
MNSSVSTSQQHASLFVVFWEDGFTPKLQDDAFLWNGTAASAVDLAPTNLSGFTSSVAYGTNGVQQVGDAVHAATTYPQAFLWSGSGATAVDLHTSLPASGVWTDSIADTIDTSGNAYGIADGTFGGVSGTFAVEWSPVPEPATESLLLIGGAGILLLRRRKQLA